MSGFIQMNKMKASFTINEGQIYLSVLFSVKNQLEVVVVTRAQGTEEAGPA